MDTKVAKACVYFINTDNFNTWCTWLGLSCLETCVCGVWLYKYRNLRTQWYFVFSSNECKSSTFDKTVLSFKIIQNITKQTLRGTVHSDSALVVLLYNDNISRYLTWRQLVTVLWGLFSAWFLNLLTISYKYTVLKMQFITFN